MVRDGIFYALGFTAGGAFVSWLLDPWKAMPLFLLAAFCAWFFRDPERPIPVGPVAVSPADGRVMSVVAEGPGVTRVSIFLNVFDVHVNRSPISGVLTTSPTSEGSSLWPAARMLQPKTSRRFSPFGPATAPSSFLNRLPV